MIHCGDPEREQLTEEEDIRNISLTTTADLFIFFFMCNYFAFVFKQAPFNLRGYVLFCVVFTTKNRQITPLFPQQTSSDCDPVEQHELIKQTWKKCLIIS